MYDDYDTYNSYSYEDEEAYDWPDIPEEEVDWDHDDECCFCGRWIQNCRCESEELL